MKKLLIIVFLSGAIAYGQSPIRTTRLSVDTVKISNTATLPTHPTSGVKETWYRRELWLTDSLNHYRALSTKHLSGISGVLKAVNDTIKVAGPVADYMPGYNLALATDYANAHLYSNGDLVRVVDGGITYIFIVKIAHVSGAIIPDPLTDMLAFGNNIHYELAAGGAGTVEGTGTIGRLSRWADTDSLDSSIWRDNGTNLGINIDPDIYHNKLIDIEDTVNLTTLYINNTKTSTGGGTNVFGADIISNSDKTYSTALRGTASGSIINTGLSGNATGGTTTYGVYGEGVSESSGTAYGGWFSASGDGTNYSLWAQGNAYFEGGAEVRDTMDVGVLEINHVLFEPSTYIDTTRIAYKDKKNTFTRGQVIDVGTLDYEYDKWWADTAAYAIKKVAKKNMVSNGNRHSYLGSLFNDTITGPKWYSGTGGFAKVYGDIPSTMGVCSQALGLEVDSALNVFGISNNPKSGYSLYSYGLQNYNTSTDTCRYFHGIFNDAGFKRSDLAYGIKSYLSGEKSNEMYGLHLSLVNEGVGQNKNVYGIYIGDVSFGTTKSYSIYSDGGNAHFADTVNAARYKAGGKLLTVIRDTTVTLSAAEVMTLYSVGKTLVAAPASGYAIEALSCSYLWTYAGDAYDSKSEVLYIGTTKNSLNTAQFGLGVFWAGTSTIYGKCQPYVTSTQAFEGAKALILSTSTSDAANGTSTLKVWITYRIITL